MSRVGTVPILLPAGVDLSISSRQVTVKGPCGELSFQVPDAVRIEFEEANRYLHVKRDSITSEAKAIHGMVRALLSNMVRGVSQLWEKRLEIVGVGYHAALNGGRLVLHVGFANPISIPVPEIVRCELPDNTHIVLKSADKQLVGQMAADIRSVRPPEPYKGKGIRYADEHVRRKAGKAFGS